MRRDWHIFVLLTGITLAVYWPVTRNQFINFDDPAYVTQNLLVQQGLTWSGVKWAFGQLHGEATYWHPVTWLSHMLDCQLFGLRAGGHHLVSLCLHTLNTLLLFGLLRRLTNRPGPSAFVAALFALHPIQVDTVAWVAERKNLLSGFFFMLTLWAYKRYAQDQSGATLDLPSSVAALRRVDRLKTLDYSLSLVFFALGLMSKPSLVPLPFVLLLLDYWPLARWRLQARDQSLKTILWEKVPFLLLSLGASAVTIRAHETLGALASVEELSIPARLANAAVAYTLYLGKLFWPSNFSVFYLHPGAWPAATVIVAALLLLTLTALALWQARRRPAFVFGWLWFLVMLVPVIGLVQAHVQAMADRFAYLPVIGVFVATAWVAFGTRPASVKYLRFLGPALALPILAACALLTSRQLAYWRDSETLLRHAVQVEPANYLARLMLGNVLFEQHQLRPALEQYQAATRLRPDAPEGWLHAGVTLTDLAHPAEAMTSLRRAAELAPGWPEVQRRIALALRRQGRADEARQAYRQLAQMMPETAEARRDLADMLAEGGQYHDAVVYYCEALREKPDFAAALNNLAMLRASCPQAEFRSGTEAVQLAEAACRLSNRRNPSFLGTLAAAYAEAGRFPDAIRTAEEALVLSRAAGATGLAQVQATMLEQFRNGQPYRQTP